MKMTKIHKKVQNGQKILFRGPKWFLKCQFGGSWWIICIEKWSWNCDSRTRSAIFGTPKIAEMTYFGYISIQKFIIQHARWER